MVNGAGSKEQLMFHAVKTANEGKDTQRGEGCIHRILAAILSKRWSKL